MQGDETEQLSKFVHTPIGAVSACLAIVAAVFVLRWLWYWVRIFINYIFHQPSRKKIFKAADSLEKSVSTAMKEMNAYKGALQALLAQYGADKTGLSQPLDALKLEITRLTLPKLNPAKFQDIRDRCYIHLNTDLYYGAFYNGVMLSGFCNLYREFFAQDNWHHLEAVETLIGSLYHATPLKAHAEYIAKKAPDQDADYAIRYFTAYAKLLDDALGHADALQKDLVKIKSDNIFIWWLAGGS